MQCLFPHPYITLILISMWSLLVNSIALNQLILGVFLGCVIPLFARRFWTQVPTMHRPFIALRLIMRIIMDIFTANIAVARLIIDKPQLLRPAFINIPLVLRSNLAISLLGNIICLAPGTVSSRLSLDQRYLLVHALNVADPDQLIATIKAHYESPLQEIFEPC